MDEQDTPPEGALTVDRGLLLRRRGGAWEPVEPLRRHARDVTALNREYAGRYVCVHNPGGLTVSVFADRFAPGVLYWDGGHELRYGPDTTIAHDPHGRQVMIDNLVSSARREGRAEVVGQLRERAAQLARYVTDAEARGDDVGVERCRAQQAALEMEADLAAGIAPSVTPTNLGVVDTVS